MTEPTTILLFGRPGAGKGTQFARVTEYLRANHASYPTFELSWSSVRDAFLQGDSFVQRRARALTESGELLPAFLAPVIWSQALMEHFDGSAHLVVDGIPRQLVEAKTFDSFLEFYECARVVVLNLEISEAEARSRVHERARKENRADDSDDERIDRRMEWFKTETLPVLDFFTESDRYRVIDIDASGSIEEVSARIFKSLS